ncbi:hypothetical protein [Alkaliphilus peptidifermentans]|uniref:Uncharacterized protein n=1 Tax=Alkaliphilus peptidifermentans DSM 18978 TaxID=1120976 RepID=A0A1G5CXW1_9FIRM|nr:hypothetical protein [Alkaliphilus peptidifermentans]SCY07285.1 hypothetical protein SAMN03080606_00805 [Alkaliphilus peptidifermentans DSM 18978]
MKQKSINYMMFIFIGVISYYFLSFEMGFIRLALLAVICIVYGGTLYRIYDIIEDRAIDERIIIPIDLLSAYLFTVILNRFLANPVPAIFILIPIFLKNIRGEKQFKVILAIALAIILLVGVYIPVREFNMKYEVVENTINSAKNNESLRMYVVNEEEYIGYRNYGNLEVFNKEEFKEIVKEHDIINYKPKTSLLYKIRQYHQNETLIFLSYYDSTTGDEAGRLILILNKVNGNWKIVGQLNSN